MPQTKDLKKALDQVLGDEFTTEELQTLQLFLKVASWNRVEEGFVTKTSPLIPGKFCESQKLLEVSGVAATGGNGTVRFLLTQFICFDQASFEAPIHVVATPLASKPFFVTVRHSLVLDPTNTFGVDVAIEAFTWDPNGAAAPKVPFNWFCRVPFEDPIF
jgi:hypothetical protein